MRYYYNWSPEQRMEGDRLVKQAIQEGKLPDPNTQPCAICGTTYGTHHYHQEDYTPEHIVENSICVCATCHREIHMRWWHMQNYRQYMARKVNGEKYIKLFDEYYQKFRDGGGIDPARKC